MGEAGKVNFHVLGVGPVWCSLVSAGKVGVGGTLSLDLCPRDACWQHTVCGLGA